MKQLDINIKKAHSNAKKTLNSSFYWKGTELGGYAIKEFFEAKNNDNTISPISFIKKYLKKNEYDELDLYETDLMAIEEFNEKQSMDQYLDSYEAYEQLKKELLEEIPADEEAHIEEATALIECNHEDASMNAASIHVDDIIIGVCFFQFYLDGFINKELYEITKIALDRETDSIDKFSYELRDSRIKKLKVLHKDLLKMKKFIK